VAGGVAICQTMAHEGARIRHGNLDQIVPAVAQPGEVVDPDGAGDTFAACVIAARWHGADWATAVSAASVLVARAIGVPGPMTVSLRPHDLSAALAGQVLNRRGSAPTQPRPAQP
jgi:sugar/nucleoside kinase (ribokinase family)